MGIWNISLFDISYLINLPEVSHQPCSSAWFTCNNGLSIPTWSRCDGGRDCPGGEDEEEVNCCGQFLNVYIGYLYDKSLNPPFYQPHSFKSWRNGHIFLTEHFFIPEPNSLSDILKRISCNSVKLLGLGHSNHVLEVILGNDLTSTRKKLCRPLGPIVILIWWCQKSKLKKNDPTTPMMSLLRHLFKKFTSITFINRYA